MRGRYPLLRTPLLSACQTPPEGTCGPLILAGCEDSVHPTCTRKCIPRAPPATLQEQMESSAVFNTAGPCHPHTARVDTLPCRMAKALFYPRPRAQQPLRSRVFPSNHHPLWVLAYEPEKITFFIQARSLPTSLRHTNNLRHEEQLRGRRCS